VAFGNLLKDQEYGGKEKHLPTIEISKGSDGDSVVTVTVGKEIAHPNTVEHHIAYLEVYGVKGDEQVIALGKADFGPSYTSPKVTIETSLADMETVYAISYCNIHGLWQYGVKV
jgi:superoxide reductase